MPKTSYQLHILTQIPIESHDLVTVFEDIPKIMFSATMAVDTHVGTAPSVDHWNGYTNTFGHVTGTLL